MHFGFSGQPHLEGTCSFDGGGFGCGQPHFAWALLVIALIIVSNPKKLNSLAFMINLMF
jgi:hypothetical protein